MIEYTNRNKMEETSGKVFARLHHMKTILCKTIKKTPQFCGGITHRDNSYCSPTSYYSISKDDSENLSESTNTSLINITSDDTISSISGDSGVSTLSDFSHDSLLSRTITMTQSGYLRCDPSIINYLSHNLLTTDRTEDFLNEIDQTLTTDLPLAESSRRYVSQDDDQTIVATDNDYDEEQSGPLTSTLIDRWYTIIKPYSAIFRQDLTVRKTELVQVLRCTHPHWVWVRNEESSEGFIPTDCLLLTQK